MVIWAHLLRGQRCPHQPGHPRKPASRYHRLQAAYLVVRPKPLPPRPSCTHVSQSSQNSPSRRDKNIDGRFLSTNGTALGIFNLITPAPAVRVYPVTDRKTGLVELHTYPPGKVDQVVALVGDRNGLLTFSSVANPASAAFPGNTVCDWKSFRLGGGAPPAPGRSDNLVTYEAAAGSWAAFPSQNPGDWALTFKNCAYCPVPSSPNGGLLLVVSHRLTRGHSQCFYHNKLHASRCSV